VSTARRRCVSLLLNRSTSYALRAHDPDGSSVVRDEPEHEDVIVFSENRLLANAFWEKVLKTHFSRNAGDFLEC
jgi:hypothetical protein